MRRGILVILLLSIATVDMLPGKKELAKAQQEVIVREVKFSKPLVKIKDIHWAYATDLANILDAKIEWRPKTSELVIQENRGLYFIVFEKGKTSVNANLERFEIPQPIWFENEKAVVPVGITCEALGYEVSVEAKGEKKFLVISKAAERIEIELEEQLVWIGLALKDQIVYVGLGDWMLYEIQCSSGRGWQVKSKDSKHDKNKKIYANFYWVMKIDGANGWSIDFNCPIPYKFYLSPKSPKQGMYYCKVSIHGYKSVPNTPQSHGCVRIPIPIGKGLYEKKIIPIGTPVQVFPTRADFKPWRELFNE